MQTSHAGCHLRGLIFPTAPEYVHARCRVAADRRQLLGLVRKSPSEPGLVHSLFAHRLVTQIRLVRASYAQAAGSQAVSPIDVHQHARLQRPSRCRGRLRRALHRVRGYRGTRRPTVWTVSLTIGVTRGNRGGLLR